MNNFNVKYFTLSYICDRLKTKLEEVGILNKKFWVEVEIHKFRLYQSGSCFLELVEKDKNGKDIVAQMDGIIFASDFLKIDKKFRKINGQSLKEGIKVLAYSQIIYHPKYGLRLRILDISPEYLYGQIYLQRQQTISKLKELGIFDKNKHLKIPLLPFNIAVISTDSSKGFNDFKQIILNSGYNIKFDLYEVVLQGEKAYKTIISQLESIKKSKIDYDLVVIIRGGGGDVTLLVYDDFEFAKYIAEYPLPIFTGIGHSTNETVVEMVANKSFITPTALAHFIVERFKEVENNIDILGEKLNYNLFNKLNFYKEKIEDIGKLLYSLVQNKLSEYNINSLEEKIFLLVNGKLNNLNNKLNHFNKILYIFIKKNLLKWQNEIDNLEYKLNFLIKNYFHFLNQRLEMFSERLSLLDIDKNLKKGYSIVLKDNRVVKSIKELKEGDELKIKLNDGYLRAVIKEVFSGKK